MERYKRYAVYFTPDPGALASFGAAWLGWDIEEGQAVGHPQLPGLTQDDIATMTRQPRRYGFHATLKPPFALAPGGSVASLLDDLREICAVQGAVRLMRGLRLARLDGFVALVPAAPSEALQNLAASLVEGLDFHRATMTASDRARRNPDALTQAQRDHLDRWGYPWVMSEFSFHMTLSGSLPLPQADRVMAALDPVLAPMIAGTFDLNAVTLAGEDADGMFHKIARLRLSGQGQAAA